ncbi:hypothetical protein [Mesorhizobium sp.]|uniref:hypothetical protein n=1 Tax=Mesorhizobium sp. TaxID=1871066 RepID=UPI00257AF5D8|nr:hypothetical protein [Mesorhizobium sp.]
MTVEAIATLGMPSRAQSGLRLTMIAGGSAAAAADRQQRNRGGASRPFSLLPGRCQMLPNRLGSTHYNPLITKKKWWLSQSLANRSLSNFP